MKQLILFRHAKAEPHDVPGPDHSRELSNRGRRDAAAMGAILGGRELVPDLVLASDSVRTRETATIAAAQWDQDPEVTWLTELYSAGVAELLTAVAVHGGSAGRVMVVGHNPAVEELASLAAGRHVRLRPGAVAVLETDVIRWEELAGPGALRLVDVIDRPDAFGQSAQGE